MQVQLEMFPKAASTTTKKHNTIFKSILMDKSNRIFSGSLPRDLKESANIIDYTGGRSLICPPDGDGFTESTIGWHVQSSGLLLGLSTLEFYNRGQEGETESTTSLQLRIMPGAQSSDHWKLRINLTELLGAPFNCVERNADMMVFYWKTGGDSVNSTLAVHLEMTDSNGTVISSLRPGSFNWGNIAPRNWTPSTWRLGPECNVAADVGIPGSQQGVDYWIVKLGSNPKASVVMFDLKSIVSIDLCFDFVIPLGGGSMPSAFFRIYIDRFGIRQDYVPTYRSILSGTNIGSTRYGPRMMPVSVPEILEYAPLKAYANKVAISYAAPTFFVDVTCLHDPATELIWAGYGVRFNIPAWGVTESLWWRAMTVIYQWERKKGFTLRVVAVPAASAVEDYSNVVSSKYWTNALEGLYSNIIDKLRSPDEKSVPVEKRKQ
jgi:hypothetical protein